MGLFLVVIILSQCCPVLAALNGEEKVLRSADIRPIMEELFQYHVEHKKLTPLLVQRSFKSFIEQFDPDKIYFLKKEVEPYLEMRDPSLRVVVAQYARGDFTLYEKCASVIEMAIERAREIRLEVERSLILSREKLPQEIGESYLRYAMTEKGLRERIERQLIRFLHRLQSEEKVSLKEPAERERAFTFLEKRLARFEKNYLRRDKLQKESYLSLQILKSLARSLDAHTAFYSAQEAFDLRARLEKQFEGVGVVLREGIDGIVVSGVIAGGPAARSGKIAAGDLLVEIDGQPLVDLSYDEVLSSMQGDGKHKKITLTLQREGEEGLNTIRVSLEREKILMEEERLQVGWVPYGQGIIGTLTLPAFYESEEAPSCEADIRAALLKLKQKGRLVGLILDLRDNSGGFLTQAVKSTGLFVTNGVIVISKYAEGEMRYMRAIDGRLYYDGPFLLLTSRASASAAEIVAQSLQDYGTALIVGDDHTYGKGSIQYQTLTDDEASAFFKVTVGRYYTVSGRSTQIEGVAADIRVPTAYASYRIGERFLNYPLSADRVAAAYVDPLTDLHGSTKRWFQNNYLPYLEQPRSKWRKMLPLLRANSAYRLEHDPNFKAFLKTLDGSSNPASSHPWGAEDPQMAEAIKIVEDMITLSDRD